MVPTIATLSLMILTLSECKRIAPVLRSKPNCEWKPLVLRNSSNVHSGIKELAFLPIADNAKFLVPDDLSFRTTCSSARELCVEAGLDPAYIDTIQGYHDVVRFYQAEKEIRQGNGVRLPIATRSKGDEFEEELKFTKATKNTLFQAFDLATCSYLEENKDCLGMQCKEDKCVFQNIHCGETGAEPPIPAELQVVPLCQLKEAKAKCHEVDTHSWIRQDELKRLFSIGTTSKRELFGSAIQSSFDAALSFCQRIEMKLLSFTKNDQLETTQVMDILKRYADKMNIPGHLALTWTAGRFTDKYKRGDSFQWASSNRTWEFSDNGGHFRWFPGVVMRPEVERCLVLARLQDKLIRPVACSLKNFFVCTKDKSGVTGRAILSEPVNKTSVNCAAITPGGNACACHTQGCGFNEVTGDCVELRKECLKHKCARKSTFVAAKGEICHNSGHHSPCPAEETLLALNLHGKNHTGSNGIFYSSDDKVKFSDASHLIQNSSILHECPTVEGIEEGDAALYESTVHSYSKILESGDFRKDPCLSYKVPVYEDGSYELSVLLVESIYSRPGQRLFDIKLNNLTVGQNVDIIGLIGETCKAAEVVVHFEVRNMNLMWAGQEESMDQRKRQVSVRFCMGQCVEAKSVAFRVAAFSVVRTDTEIPGQASSEDQN